MNKIFTFGLVALFLMLVGSTVYGLDNTLDFQDKIHFHLETPTTDYKEAYYPVNKNVPITFHMEVLGPPSPRVFTVGYVDMNDTFYPCYTETMYTGNETYYARCSLEFNDTGIYFISLKLDSIVYELEGIEIKDALPSPFGIGLLILGALLLFFGLRYAKELLILGGLIFNFGILDLIFTYAYLLNPIFVGVICLYIIGNFYLVFLIMKDW